MNTITYKKDVETLISGNGEVTYTMENGHIRLIEWKNGLTEWVDKGVLHRNSGPAVIKPDGSKEWYCYGKRHRLAGPAVEKSDGSKEYWIHDKQIEDETAWELLANMVKLKDLL